MEETVFPPSPSWFLPNIVTAREDGLVAYGSKTAIVILKPKSHVNVEMTLIRNCHTLKITGVAFSPSNCEDSVQNTIVSCSEDGYVKLFNTLTSSVVMGHKSHWDQQQKQLGKVVSLDWSTANCLYVFKFHQKALAMRGVNRIFWISCRVILLWRFLRCILSDSLNMFPAAA